MLILKNIQIHIFSQIAFELKIPTICKAKRRNGMTPRGISLRPHSTVGIPSRRGLRSRFCIYDKRACVKLSSGSCHCVLFAPPMNMVQLKKGTHTQIQDKILECSERRLLSNGRMPSKVYRLSRQEEPAVPQTPPELSLSRNRCPAMLVRHAS